MVLMNSKTNHLKNFLSDRFILFPLIAGLIVLFLSLILFYLNLSILKGGKIVLHLSLKGVGDLVGSSSWVLFLIFCFWILFLLNQFLAYSFYHKEKVLAYLFSYFSLWFVLLGLFFVYSLTLIN